MSTLFDENDPGDRLILDYLGFWRAEGLKDNDPGHVFYQDVGTVIVPYDDSFLDELLGRMRHTLETIKSTCSESWRWSWEDRTIFHSEDLYMLTSNSTSPRVSVCEPPPSPRVIDSRRWLWISFDSAKDAMLVRMIIDDLRNERHANGGRMSHYSTHLE